VRFLPTRVTGGLQPYKNKCLSNMAIEYVGCTEGRGIGPTTEISGGIGGTLEEGLLGSFRENGGGGYDGGEIL
jgi:hypothetical protein